ncbi:ATP-binding protein [Spirochaeta dissipatitropha]
MEFKLRVLREVYFFHDLSEVQLEALADRCQVAHYPRETVIFTEQSRAERFFIVASGSVGVWKNYYTDKPDLLGEHGAGHLFGEMGLIDDQPRSATVATQVDSTLLYVEKADFLELVKQHCEMGMAIIRSMSAMMRTSNESFVSDLRKRNQDLETTNFELKRAHQELLRGERLSNLGKFSSLILHDIRNPLSIIKGYTELIEMHADDAEQVRAYSKTLMNEIQRLNSITNEFLDYSRGEIRLDLSVVEMKDLFDWLRGSVEKNFIESGKELIFCNEVSRPVLLDLMRIQRVWYNLAENARKALDTGGKLTISAWNDDTSLYIEFKDTGVGMDSETQASMFEPFFSRSSKGGTGLGMVIVKSVVEAHSGSISVKSGRGKGTSIQLCLPLMG